MFHIDISKHVRKSPENFEKFKTRKDNRQHFEKLFFAKNGTYVKQYTVGHLCIKFEEFILIHETMIAKNEFDPFCCKLGQSDPIVTKLKLHMSCHLLNVNTKF